MHLMTIQNGKVVTNESFMICRPKIYTTATLSDGSLRLFEKLFFMQSATVAYQR